MRPQSQASASSHSANKLVISPFRFSVPRSSICIDAAQRSVLFWDVMRQRGNQYRDHLAETAPHVLDYEAELLIDGRRLDRPVNYALARVVPPAGIEIDPIRRPFVVIDPRAGHGPGLAVLKRIVKSASPSRRAIRAISLQRAFLTSYGCNPFSAVLQIAASAATRHGWPAGRGGCSRNPTHPGV